MGVSSPPRPKPKRTRQDRSPQLEHMCRPRTRQIPGCSPAHLRRAGPGTNAGLPTPRGEPSTDRSEPPETEERRSAGSAAQHQARRVLPPEGASGRDYRDVHLRGTAGNGRSPTEEMAREKRANSADRSTGAADDGDDATAGDGDVGANDDAAGQASFPLLRTEHWHLLVRLPDRPSDEEIRQLPGPVLAALLRANGICRPDGCTREDAWTAIARWLTTHPAQPLALPLGRLRLAPSPQRGRGSARPRSSQSYDGMIETASESAAAATQSMSDAPPEQDLPSPGIGAARGPLDVCGRKLSSRQAELLRHLPPAPSAADLRPLSIAALRELLRANGVVPRPRTRKKALRATALRLVAIEGAIIRLPAGLSRASDGVAVSPAFPPDEEKTGDDVTRRALGNNQGRTEHDHLSAGADQRAGNPSGAPRCPLHAHGAPGDASTRAPELPPMPHRAPAYPADPDSGKLSAAVIAALEGLPPRPSAAQLRETKFAGLQVLMKANGVPRPNNATVESMTRQLGAWLAENDDRALELPHGIQRSGWRPLGDPAAVHRAGRSAGSGRRTRDMSPPPHDGHTGTAPTGPDADLLAHLGAPAHPANAPRRPQASGWVSPSTLRRPYNGSGETGKPGGSTASRGAGSHDDDQLVDDGQIARAAVAFTDSAASTLALLDRLAPLIDRACRGESIPAEALATLGPAVHTARAVLQGAVAGCTAERLRPTLTRASGGNIASATGGPSHAGAPRTYAQVASTAPPPSRRSLAAPLVPERTALLSPDSEERRHAPTRASAFGGALDAVLRRELGLGARPAVEEVRRTGKGDYAVQFGTAAWERMEGTVSWTLPGFGVWHRASTSPFRQRSSLVLTGIPSTMTDAALRQELVTGAATRWPALPAEDLQDIRVVRLNRRVPASNQPSSSLNGGTDWAPSTSIRLFASKVLCETILKEGGTVVGFTFRPARAFQPAKRRCMRCGQLGVHSAKYCRNTPRCRHCGLPHETSGCPSHPQGQNRSSRQADHASDHADRSPRSWAAPPS